MLLADRLHPLEDLDRAAGEFLRVCAGADDRTRQRLRDDFVRLGLPFARRMAGRYYGRGEPAEDLDQVARLGLVTCVDRFDPERGSFVAYATVTITGELKRHFRNHCWGVHVTRRMQELTLELGRAKAALEAELSRVPTDEEVARRLHVDVCEVREATASAAAYAPGSLNARADGSQDSEVGDLLGAIDPAMAMVDDRATVEQLILRLPERERHMLALRFWGNRSQAEIAQEWGITQMHVSRLLARALTWLRQAMLSDEAPPWPWAGDTDHRLIVRVTSDAQGTRAWVTGEVDRDNADYLRDRLLALLPGDRPGRHLLLDLAGLPLLDAAGIGVLVAVHEAARTHDVTVRVTGLQPYAARIVAASGLRFPGPTATI
jgi:RNA polymerase sigma-B factor